MKLMEQLLLLFPRLFYGYEHSAEEYKEGKRVFYHTFKRRFKHYSLEIESSDRNHYRVLDNYLFDAYVLPQSND